MTTPIIEFEHVSKGYPRSGDALKDLSFRLNAGEMAFLTGHSGAGKTTLLRLIGLLERPTRGRVTVNGRDLGRLPTRQVPMHRREVGMIFQDHRLLSDRSVLENAALPLAVAGVHPRDRARRARAALDQVGLLARERSFPLELSSGEQQRVGIARALAARPRVILADEPTGNLDPKLSQEIFELFERLNGVGISLLIATHDLGLLAGFGRRTLRLHSGRLVADSANWQAAAP